jgi:hydroxymethylglutaryl-CoA reductase
MQNSQFPGFYRLSVKERLRRLTQASATPEALGAFASESGLTIDAADHMIENVIAIFGLPLGIALNFLVNDKDVLVPMAVEEPSVVAGASFMAKLARAGGGFRASSSAPEMIGQIQLLDVQDTERTRMTLLSHKAELLAEADSIDPVLKKVGGGARDLEVRIIEHSPIGAFIVIHLIYDVRDAMGANAVNTACERLAPQVESITGGRVHLRILSNLADRRVCRASCTIPAQELSFAEYSGESVRDGIIEAWAFAASDPYRAATHNKGIMNGVDAVVIATGNDWRAIEAGAHAYAARGGRYTSLSTWRSNAAGDLVGELEMPMAVGTVGGATRVHPLAQAALRMMGIEKATDLAEIIASVGLAQNMAALRALATEGIQRGHMSLHARQVAIAAGATGELIEKVATRMVSDRIIRIDHAAEIMNDLSGHTSGQD